MCGAPVPHRREPRHAVPDLDRGASERPIRPVSSRRHRARRTPSTCSPGGHPVAVAPCRRREAGGGRRAVHDVEAGRRPAAHELVGVELGPPGVGIVEVAPGQHVDPAHAALPDVGDELVDRVRRRHAGKATDSAASSGWGVPRPAAPPPLCSGRVAGETTGEMTEPRPLPTVVPVIAAAVIVLIPAIVAAIAVLRPQWYPTGDMAQAELHVRGFWSHPPLVGAAGRIANADGVSGSHPGPLLWLAMWPMYAIGGATSASLVVSVVLVHVATLVLALWLAVRRGGLGLRAGAGGRHRHRRPGRRTRRVHRALEPVDGPAPVPGPAAGLLVACSTASRGRSCSPSLPAPTACRPMPATPSSSAGW